MYYIDVGKWLCMVETMYRLLPMFRVYWWAKVLRPCSTKVRGKGNKAKSLSDYFWGI